jgi:hypothetical protein
MSDSKNSNFKYNLRVHSVILSSIFNNTTTDKKDVNCQQQLKNEKWRTIYRFDRRIAFPFVP